VAEDRLAPTAGRLDRALALGWPELSRSRLAELVREGQVWVDGAPATRPAQPVEAGSRLTVALPDPEPAQAIAQDLPLVVVFEDPDLAVIDKAAGMVVHPGAGHRDGTLVNALLHHLDDLSGIGGVLRPGLVHRLDRGTSGLLVVAKHDRAHQALAEQFAAHTAGRNYLALCWGDPGDGARRSHLARHPTDRLRFASTKDGSGKAAVTHHRVRGRAGRVSLVECRLETGRTHQVRVHLAEAGCPLVGDRTYQRGELRGNSRLRAWQDAEPERPLLHAWVLRLTHPRTGEGLRFQVRPPPDFQLAAAAAGLDLPEEPEL
jgi:23S rRNA pseudouridine1911/1915/1917 synthase